MKRIKTGGRKAGVPNRSTTELKNLVHSFLQANIKDLQAQYDELKPADKLDFFQKLLRFALPTQSQAKIDLDKLSNEDLDLVIDRLKNKEL
ncbi:hypothetical protein [Niabella aquatica]